MNLTEYRSKLDSYLVLEYELEAVLQQAETYIRGKLVVLWDRYRKEPWYGKIRRWETVQTVLRPTSCSIGLVKIGWIDREYSYDFFEATSIKIHPSLLNLSKAEFELTLDTCFGNLLDDARNEYAAELQKQADEISGAAKAQEVVERAQLAALKEKYPNG